MIAYENIFYPIERNQMSIQPICMRRKRSIRNGEYFVAEDDDLYSPHENFLHMQHHRKAKEKQRIFSLSLLIPQQLLCMLCVPIQLFFTKTWCLGRIIPPLLQSTVVFLLRKTWLNITSEMFSCLCQNAIISKCFIVNKIKGYDLFISHLKICLNYVSIH